MAAQGDKVDVLDQLWEWTKEVLNTDEINNKLLLAKEYDEETVLHHASFSENVQIIERIWKWAKGQLTPEEIKQ